MGTPMALTPTEQELARRNETALRDGLRVAKQANVAAALSVDPGTITRWRDDHARRAGEILALCGLRIVPASAKHVSPQMLAALQTLAAHACAHPTESAPSSGFGQLDEVADGE